MRYTLAFEGGATRTSAGLIDAAGVLVAAAEGGPSNPLSVGVGAAAARLGNLGAEVMSGLDGSADAAALALAGIGNERTRRALVAALWWRLPVNRIVAVHDVAALLYANLDEHPGMVAVAGTGSSVFVQSGDGIAELLGGRGAVFGESGGAYGIAVAGMKACGLAADKVGPPTTLAEALPEAAGVASLHELVVWSTQASKEAVASLARSVSEMARQGDAVSSECIVSQAEQLASLVLAAARNTGLDTAFTVLTAGGVFANCAQFRETFAAKVRSSFPDAEIHPAPLQGLSVASTLARSDDLPPYVSIYERMEDTREPITEDRLEDGRALDDLSALEIAQAMSVEDRQAAEAVAARADVIAETIEVVARGLSAGGRLIYVGAGTSGRLGILDAAECTPTFGAPPGKVVGLIAGGEAALRSSIEGAEDDRDAAIRDLARLNPPLSRRDVVIGISASGGATYVHAMLERAHEAGAAVALITCNPHVRFRYGPRIVLDTGPEILPGSTRLKAGTATKMVLNQISTGAFARSGYVYGGLMIGVQPTNEKLRRRGTRIVAELTDCPEPEAAELLARAGGRVAVAVLMAKLGLSAEDAARRLEVSGGTLRDALSEH